jgi:hypothetical protein
MVTGLIKATIVEGIKNSNTISTPPSSTTSKRREETQALRNLNTIRINTSSTGVVAEAAILLGEVSTNGRVTLPKARGRLCTREPSRNHLWWKVRTVRVSCCRAPSSRPHSPCTRIRNTLNRSKNTMSSPGLATSPLTSWTRT